MTMKSEKPSSVYNPAGWSADDFERLSPWRLGQVSFLQGLKKDMLRSGSVQREKLGENYGTEPSDPAISMWKRCGVMLPGIPAFLPASDRERPGRYQYNRKKAGKTDDWKTGKAADPAPLTLPRCWIPEDARFRGRGKPGEDQRCFRDGGLLMCRDPAGQGSDCKGGSYSQATPDIAVTLRGEFTQQPALPEQLLRGGDLCQFSGEKRLICQKEGCRIMPTYSSVSRVQWPTSKIGWSLGRKWLYRGWWFPVCAVGNP